MNADRGHRSAHDVEREMEDEAGRMQRRLDELGEHVEQAAKKAEHTREHTDVHGDDEPLDTVAGDATQRTTSSDDPASAVGNPAEAEEGQ